MITFGKKLYGFYYFMLFGYYQLLKSRGETSRNGRLMIAFISYIRPEFNLIKRWLDNNLK